jgi:hypothetical protein
MRLMGLFFISLFLFMLLPLNSSAGGLKSQNYYRLERACLSGNHGACTALQGSYR